jgi:hypothetical protein
MSERLTRQSFLGPRSEEALSSLTVGVVGLGGGGSHIVQQLAHAGVGGFVLCDPQRVEESNLNRLVGAIATDVRRQALKAEVARRVIKHVSPTAKVTELPTTWQEGADYLRGCDVIVGCLDSYRQRAELEQQARRYLIPYLDLGMDVHDQPDGTYLIAGQVILSLPGQACLRCLGFVRDELLLREAEGYGAAGYRPQVVWANGVLASVAVGLLIELVSPWHRKPRTVVYLEYDGNTPLVRSCNRLLAAPKTCRHYDPTEVGDPWFGDAAAVARRPPRPNETQA